MQYTLADVLKLLRKAERDKAPRARILALIDLMYEIGDAQ
jgi:hypothetical protein